MNYRVMILSAINIVNCCYGFSAQDIHQYMWANYCQFEGNHQLAAQWYNKVYRPDMSVHAYKGYIMFLYETGSFDKVVALIPTVEKQFAQDADLQLLLARALEQTGKMTLANEKILTLVDTFKSHPEIVFQAAHAYVQRKEPENALKAIDTFLNTSPRRSNNFIFYFVKAQIYVQLGKQEQALEQVKICLDMHPGFSKGWLMLALLEEQRGKLEEAIKGYTSFLETSGQGNQQVEQHLVQLTFKQQVAQKNANMLIMNKSPFDKALYFLEKKEYAKAIEQVDACLAAKPSDEQARFLKIQILSAMGQQVQAADLLKTWLLKEPSSEVWLKTLHLLCRTGLTHQKAIAVLEDVLKAHPKELQPLLYLVDLATRTKTRDGALMYYKKALELTEDPSLKTRLYFHMAHVYYDQQKWDSMRDVLEKGYALGTDFPPLLNMLAYYYATGSRNLERAQYLIDKALSFNKSNPHFRDTQALVCYKQKQYNKAVAILESVVKQVPDDFEALKHLSKTYFRLGNSAKAQALLQRARTVAKTDYEKQKCDYIGTCWSKPS